MKSNTNRKIFGHRKSTMFYFVHSDLLDDADVRLQPEFDSYDNAINYLENYKGSQKWIGIQTVMEYENGSKSGLIEQRYQRPWFMV